MPKAYIRSISPATLSRAADIIKVLGHPERLKIVEALEHREATVSEVQDAVGLPQPIVSQQLAKMRGCGIVAQRREGVHVYYHIVEPKVHHILRCVRTCDM